MADWVNSCGVPLVYIGDLADAERAERFQIAHRAMCKVMEEAGVVDRDKLPNFLRFPRER